MKMRLRDRRRWRRTARLRAKAFLSTISDYCEGVVVSSDQIEAVFRTRPKRHGGARLGPPVVLRVRCAEEAKFLRLSRGVMHQMDQMMRGMVPR